MPAGVAQHVYFCHALLAHVEEHVRNGCGSEIANRIDIARESDMYAVKRVENGLLMRGLQVSAIDRDDCAFIIIKLCPGQI